MKAFPLHAPSHTNHHACCMCGGKFPHDLLEVWSAGNWHPICRDCLTDIDLAVLGPFTDGRRIRQTECVGQGVMVL